MQSLTVEEDGNSKARILDHPCLNQVPVLCARPGRERVVRSHEFVKEDVGAEAIAGNLFGQGLIHVILIDNGGQL